MKRIHIMLTFALSAFMFTACEKDDVNQPNNRTMESNSKKKTEAINKSSELFDAVVDFINGIDDDTLSVNHLAEDALKYTEATLNYRLTSDEYLPSESEIFNTTYDVPIYLDEGQLYISASEIQMMNDNLYNEIYTQADNFNFDNGNKDGKILTVIDVKWGTLSSGSQTIDIEYTLSNFKDVPILVGECDAELSWYPIFDMGGCNGNPATSGDAAQVISRIVNSKTCNSNLRPSCSQPLWFDVVSTDFLDANVPPYSSTEIWYDSDYNVCLSPIRINELEGYCQSIAQQLKPSGYELKNVTVGENVITSIPSSYYHFYQYFYGKCIGELEHSLYPCFDCN